MAAGEQADRRVVDPWEDLVLRYAEQMGGEIRIADALSSDSCIGMPKDRHDQAAHNRVARILKAAGWRRERQGGGKRSWVYRRPSPSAGVPVAPGDTGTAQPPDAEGELDGRPSRPSSSAHAIGAEAAGAAGMNGAAIHVHANARGSGDINETVGTNWDTGTPWTDDRAWLRRMAAARRSDERVVVLGQWAQAAGGGIRCVGEVLHLELPASLDRRLAWAELHRFAREAGLSGLFRVRAMS